MLQLLLSFGWGDLAAGLLLAAALLLPLGLVVASEMIWEKDDPLRAKLHESEDHPVWLRTRG